MDNMEFSDSNELRCEEHCVYEWVDCVEELQGAAICKTRERNCFGECA
ncbi:MAG: hypothetical protein RBT11_03935 [Desulfobacterales bacterium]|jgi:hypothetical protein|nr:hypothetical protein [Desulfobacterales bacterium]